MLLIFVQNLHEIIIITFISGEGPDIKYFTYVLAVGKLSVGSSKERLSWNMNPFESLC